jgi:hypothetical protein
VRSGGVAERFKAPVLKTGVRESVPWVRIPPPPPLKLFTILIYKYFIRDILGLSPILSPN